MTTRITRIVGALVALWSLVASGSPVALHRCPVHVAAASRTAGAAGGMSHHAMGLDADAAMPGMDDGGESPQSPSDHGDDCCRCLTCGCAPAAVALPSLAVVVLPSSDVAVPRAAFPTADAPRLERTPHVLPFANGPPLV